MVHSTPMNAVVKFVDEVTPEPELEERELPPLVWDSPELSQRYNELKLPRRKVDREKVAAQFADVFELIGGVPRMALWAHNNPDEYYKLYARLLPQQMQSKMEGKLELVCSVKPTKLDQHES